MTPYPAPSSSPQPAVADHPAQEIRRQDRLRHVATKCAEIFLTRRLNWELAKRWGLENAHVFHQTHHLAQILAPVLERQPRLGCGMMDREQLCQSEQRIQYLRHRIEKERELVMETRRRRKRIGFTKRVDFCHTCIGLTESLADTPCGHRICWMCIASLEIEQAQPHECGICWREIAWVPRG